MQKQTPGVYTNELNAFPNSVVEVATAVPVFIGYTAKADYNGKNLANKPRRVTSLKEYETYFGQGAVPVFDLKEAPTPASVAAWGTALAVQPVVLQLNDLPFASVSKPTTYALVPEAEGIYYLYNSLRLFYQNGGATCYVVSIGDYAAGGDKAQQHAEQGNGANESAKSEKDKFIDAIQSLIYEQEPTMLVCPDALRLGQDEYYAVAQAMLQHCDATQRRVAVLDVYKGAVTDPRELNQEDNPITRFRNGVSDHYLKYGAGYFPWVHTTVVGSTETSFQNMSKGVFGAFVAAAAAAVQAATADIAGKPALAKTRQKSGGLTYYHQLLKDAQLLHAPSKAAGSTPKLTDDQTQWEIIRLHNALLAANADYSRLSDGITRYRNTLPVAAAMAGVFTAVDTNRGVWKAPANVGLSGVTAPTVNLSDTDQARLHVDAGSGKSVNAIRSFPGLGVLVWGARTLDGNSQDWRYINVRRTLIMLEQSIKLAARAYVFEPNDPNTWITVQSMINSFLFNLWKQGALAGATPAEAYSVAVGLGTTMTADDVLDGYLNVFVKVAVTRPAEFIVLSFQQQMQKA